MMCWNNGENSDGGKEAKLFFTQIFAIVFFFRSFPGCGSLTWAFNVSLPWAIFSLVFFVSVVRIQYCRRRLWSIHRISFHFVTSRCHCQPDKYKNSLCLIYVMLFAWLNTNAKPKNDNRKYKWTNERTSEENEKTEKLRQTCATSTMEFASGKMSNN